VLPVTKLIIRIPNIAQPIPN